MARSRPSRPARRVRGALRVYDRAGVWWAQVPGAGRRSLGLRVTDCTREDAYRAAAQAWAHAAADLRADAERELRGMAERCERIGKALEVE